MNHIQAKNLSFSYNSKELIIDHVNIEINSGDFVCLLGQSGCGKSTFLKLVAGLNEPTSGEILFDGKSRQESKPDLGVVFQDYSLFPWFSAGYNIVLALKQKFPDISTKELKIITKNYLKKVGLDEDVYYKYPNELSGGMRQRCAICRSFALNNSVMLMDEPFGALDAVTRARLQDMTLELWEKEGKKKTILFVTHDVDEAILLSNKIIVLGYRPSQVIYQYEFARKERLTREALFEDRQMMDLRNKLLKVLNDDVEKNMNLSKK